MDKCHKTAHCVILSFSEILIYILSDDEDSGEDLDVMSRGQLKKQAQQLIDQKTKRRAATKKKKGSKN